MATMAGNRVVLGEYRELQDALWLEIEELQHDDPLARVTVVVPSLWLVRHLTAAAARRFPRGLFGVRFTTFFSVAMELAGDAAARRPLAHPIVHERLLLQWLAVRDPEGRLFGHDLRTYDFAGALASAVRDLRDAAVPEDPRLVVDGLEQAAREPGSRLTAADIRKFSVLLEAYGWYVNALGAAGVLDRAAVFLRASAGGARASTPLLFYGFYDMTQVQADLVTALAREQLLTLFIPSGAPADVWRFGQWFRDTFVPTVTAETRRLPPRGAPPEPEIHSAVGEADEVWFCATEIRRLLDRGCLPQDIAVVARTLDPYAVHVKAVFRRHCIPYTGVPGLPLLEHPFAQAVRLFFRLALDDFPRQAVLDVVCHPLFRADERRARWSLCAAQMGIRRGRDWSWLDGGEDLRTGEPERSRCTGAAADIRGLGKAVASLMHRAWPDVASWREHAEAHRSAVREAFRAEGLLDQEAEVLGAVHDVLDTLAGLERFGGAVSRAEFVEAYERECRRRVLGAGSEEGVAILDAMGIRGLSFRHVFLLGLNARVFPRFIVEEPFVSDAVRREVFRVMGHHLAVRTDGYDEERLLFHLVRSAAAERFVCVYQRADARGRLRDPSPFLRPYLPLDRSRVDAVPRAEAGKRMRECARTPQEIVLEAADVEAALRVFGRDADRYARARAFLRRVEGTSEVTEYEGRTGPLAAHWGRRTGAGIAVSRLEDFGVCPFKYFAADVLGLAQADDDAREDDLSPPEIGRLLHRVLARLYTQRVEGLTDGSAAVRMVAEQVSQELEREEGLRVRGIAALRLEQIVRAVEAFAAWDLAHLGTWVPSWFEVPVEGEVGGVQIRAVLDRVDRDAASGALRIVEYKRRFGDPWRTDLRTLARRGRKLQAPLYMSVATAAALGEGGAHAAEIVVQFVENYARDDPALETIRERCHIRRLDAQAWTSMRPEISRIVQVFAGLVRDGWFFVRPQDGPRGHCARCDFPTVCRKDAARSAWKAEQAGELGAYWRIVRGEARR
jgi:RecB family exonuclease